MIGRQYLQCCDLCHLDLGEGGEDGDAALAGHGDGCVHGASQRDVDQRQQEGKQPGEGGHLSVQCYIQTMSQMSHLIELADIGQTIHHDRQNLKQQVEKCLKKKKCESVNIFFKIP